MTKLATIHGTVEYREGDGPNIVIRPGPCEVEETQLDATLSWSDDDSRGSTVMPVDDFRRYVDSAAIEIVGELRA